MAAGESKFGLCDITDGWSAQVGSIARLGPWVPSGVRMYGSGQPELGQVLQSQG